MAEAFLMIGWPDPDPATFERQLETLWRPGGGILAIVIVRPPPSPACEDKPESDSQDLTNASLPLYLWSGAQLHKLAWQVFPPAEVPRYRVGKSIPNIAS